MVCAALALLMIPALGLFYGGMVRRKNVLSAFQQSFILLGVVPVQWVLAGYSLAFGPDAVRGPVRGLAVVRAAGRRAGAKRRSGPSCPAPALHGLSDDGRCLPAALISGAIAERMKFASYLVFALLWTTLVYDPVAHWVWGPGGWIRQLGALDFAGGLVDSPHLGAGGLVLRTGAGQAEGARPRRPAPAQPDLDRAGDGSVVVRLAGPQRRAGARGQHGGGRGLRGDILAGCRGDRELERARVFPEAEGDRAGGLHRRDRRAGRGDARGRLRHSRGCA